jgi:hypothetical protein
MLAWCFAGGGIVLGLYIIMASGGPLDGLKGDDVRSTQSYLLVVGTMMVLISILSIVFSGR